DYNQNAKDRTTCSAYSIRPLPDARVSAPLEWSEVPDCDAADFTVLTMPKRFAEKGDPHAKMNEHPGSLDKLLALADEDEANGLGDAPWPPHFKKKSGEGARVAPSRAKKKASDGEAAPAKKRAPRAKKPVLTIANSPNKQAALDGLERWKNRHSDVVSHLKPEHVLVDSMRGRSSTWTRIRVNLEDVPEAMRPPQETPSPDDDPTREWREKMAEHRAKKKAEPPKDA
ncbi:MAG: DNA primase, partial [Polyangiaceae bacterium]